MFQAVTFTVNSDGIIVSYNLTPYKKNFVTEVKNKGYKPHLTGFTTVALAETTANSLVGTVLESSLPPVQEALRGGQISQSAVDQAADPSDDATIESEIEDNGLQSGNGGQAPAISEG